MKHVWPRVRWVVQIASLMLFVFLFRFLAYPLKPQVHALEWMTWMDPWVMLNHLRNVGEFPALGWISILVLLAAVVLGRVFCGWLCPFGAFLSLTDRLGRLLFRAKPLRRLEPLRRKAARVLLPFRYPLLIMLTFSFLVQINVLSPLTPFALFSGEIVRVAEGAFPWILLLFFAGTILLGRVWCAALCPTGMLLSLVSRFRLLRIRASEGCTGCKRCERACPMASVPSSGMDVEEGCVVCGDCGAACAKNALQVHAAGGGRERRRAVWKGRGYETACKGRGDETVRAAETRTEPEILTRRQFLKLSAGAAAGIALSTVLRSGSSSAKVLRPPGALLESSFRAACIRCGRCMMACPNKALQPVPISSGLDAYATPFIIARQANCCLCMTCMDVCPTGAIAKVSIEQVNMGKAAIDVQRCLAWSEDKDCFICGEQCLRLAIDITDGNKPVLNDALCVGCGTCERNCPVEGAAAIRVSPR